MNCQMKNISLLIIEAFVGFSGGIAVGAGYVAFLSVLGLIPRLFQMLNNHKLVGHYTMWMILATIIGSAISFYDFTLKIPKLFSVLWGLIHGVFIGMLAAALTEVLNVFPIILKRLQIENYLEKILLAIVLGKIFGSLYQWLVLVNVGLE